MKFVHESIFVSAVRSFCTSFAALLGILLGLVVIGVVIALASSSATLSPTKNTMVVVPDANGNRKVLAETTPAILRLDINGVIGLSSLTQSHFESLLLDSREDILKNNRVKGVLLYINTPGGTVTDSDQIYRHILAYKQKYKVPVYAYVEDLCASGGMYIASSTDKIYASPTSVIGSVGVIMGPAFNFSKIMDKIGVQSLTLSEGKDKDMLNPFRPWQPGEDQSLRTITSALYNQFVNIVTEGRSRVSREKLISEYGAHVFDSTDAQAIGYVDVANAEYNTALKDLVKAAGIAENQEYQVIKIETPVDFFSQLVQSRTGLLSGKLTHVFQIGQNTTSELSGKFLYLYEPSR